MRITPSTIARLGALLVALANQILAIFGKDILPFTEDITYQIISLAATIIIVAINAWYNNDVTKLAVLSGKVLSALKDGKITEDEIITMLEAANHDDTSGDGDSAASKNSIVQLINKGILALKAKFSKKE